MQQSTARFRNIQVILATAAGLVLMVATALGWLGWKLVSQEETLARQQAHNRLEQTADVLLTGFLRRITETEAWLSRMGSVIPSDAETAASPVEGAVVVQFSQRGVETQPAGQLLYYPIPPSMRTFDEEAFTQADTLEFQSKDLKAAAAVLSALSINKDALIRAEALLRLARVQSKAGQVSQALATYEKLGGEKLVSPLVGEPYTLLGKSKHSQLLFTAKQEAAARQEALAIVAGLESGEWPLTRESYVFYNNEFRKLAGAANEPAALQTKLAVAEAVGKLWDEWQLFQHSGSRSLTKHLHASSRVPFVAILNATSERLAGVIYAGDAIHHLALDPGEGAADNDLHVSLVDEHGGLILGSMPEANEIQTTRSLSAAELPWHFKVATAGMGGGFLPERRWFYIVTLAGIVLLVSLACYAMARGVLREAAAGRLQSDFVSAVSHEFRSPLTTLHQLTELLSEGRINDESRRRVYFATLQKETVRLYRLVEDLLDFGRIDAGRRQYKIEQLDFAELVRDGVYEYERQANGNGHHIELRSENSELLVNADREALHRVVRNLLENAVKYSPNADTVWVETGHEGHVAVLRVRDEGIGIPPEERSRIFDKFVRGQAAKEACIQGTGIGLAMVKEIVRIHRGAIDLDSEVGIGSTFRVQLPLAHAVQGSTR